MFLAIVGVVVACLIIWRACDAFESATGYLGRNLTDGVRGATFNAIGSSLPELLTTSLALLFFANKDGFAFGIGTTAGSAMFNSAIIPALVIITVIAMGLTTFVTVSKKVVLRDGLSLLACEFTLIFILTNPVLDWYHGLILVGLYGAYVTMTLVTMKRPTAAKLVQNTEDEYEDDGLEDGENRIRSLFTLNLRNFLIGDGKLSTGRSWFLLVVATAVIAAACHLLVQSCYAFGASLGIRTYFVAVILAAAATSVPDTIISIKDAMKGEYDDAVANALGSNIFDICVCLGLPLLVYCLMTGDTVSIGVDDTGSVAELRVLLLGMTGVVFLVLLFKAGLAMVEGIFLAAVYAAFVAFIILRVSGNETAASIGMYMQDFLKLIGG